MHWLASRKSAFIFEYCGEKIATRTQLAQSERKTIEGLVAVPEEPDLGIELNEEVLNRTEWRDPFSRGLGRLTGRQ